jgi:hypothetical protein
MNLECYISAYPEAVLMRKTTFGLAAQLLVFVLLTGGCSSAKGPKDFTSDGCSLFPDGDFKNRNLWCDCCFTHDIAYWRGGTEEERKQADEALRQCVQKRTKSKTMAKLMYEGVRAGGHPAFPTWYRWGYGWEYGRGYEPLTEKEQQQVREKLDAYHVKHPTGYCGEKKKNDLR